MGHLCLECVAHPRINELELVGRVTWQQMSLAPVASQVCEMRLGGLAVEVVKDRNAFTASQTRGGGDLRHLHKGIVFAYCLIRPGMVGVWPGMVGVPRLHPPTPSFGSAPTRPDAMLRVPLVRCGFLSRER